MRFTKLIFALFAFAFMSNTVMANSDPKNSTIREEIKEIVQNSGMQVDEDMKITISFLVNAKSEIIVISTNNQDYEHSIRNVLDLKKVMANDVEINKIYTLPISMKKM